MNPDFTPELERAGVEPWIVRAIASRQQADDVLSGWRHEREAQSRFRAPPLEGAARHRRLAQMAPFLEAPHEWWWLWPPPLPMTRGERARAWVLDRLHALCAGMLCAVLQRQERLAVGLGWGLPLGGQSCVARAGLNHPGLEAAMEDARTSYYAHADAFWWRHWLRACARVPRPASGGGQP